MEKLTLFAAADVHIGMRFSQYPEQQKELSQQRVESLRRCVEEANRENCSLFLVAGDLFNSVTAAEKEVKEAADILSGFSGNCVAVLPGNHDYYAGAETSVWKKFLNTAPDRLIFLREKREYPLDHYDLPVSLFPGPCDSLHGDTDAISWLRGEDISTEGRFNIGVAHGSIEGISPDLTKRYFPMMRQSLDVSGIDLWIVGHAHVPFPPEEWQDSRLLVPGTPEPDGFDCRHGGSAWVVTLYENGSTEKRLAATGKYLFRRIYKEIHERTEAEDFLGEISDMKDPLLLLQVFLSGTLPTDDFSVLGDFMDNLESSFFYFSLDSSEVGREITLRDIDSEFSEGSFPYRLLTTLLEKEDRRAVQTAWELMQDSREGGNR